MEWGWGLIRFSRDSKHLFVCKEGDLEGKTTVIQIVHMPRGEGQLSLD